MKMRTALFLMIFAFCGCAKFPTQKGTWTGVVERRTFYTARGQARDALILKIEDGPRMSDSSFRGSQVGPRERERFYYDVPILVDKDLKTFNFYELEGKRAKVSGTIQYGLAHDVLDNVELTQLTNNRELVRRSMGPLVLKTNRRSIVLIPRRGQ